MVYGEKDTCEGNVHGEYHTLAVCLKAVRGKFQRDVENLAAYSGG